MRIEGNIRAPHRLAAEPRLHLAHGTTPALGFEFVGVGAPDTRVDVHPVGVPADEGAGGDGNLVAQQGRREGYAVDELADGGVEAEELVDCGGQVGEGVDDVGGWGVRVCGEDFGAEVGLDVLHNHHQVSYR